MSNRPLRNLFALTVLTSATMVAAGAHVHVQEPDHGPQERRIDRPDHDDENGDILRLPTGQFVSPTALDDSVQQY